MRVVLPVVVAAVFAASLGLAADCPQPSIKHWMNDFADLLSASDRDAIDRELEAYERRSGNQIVVAIFPSLQGEAKEDVANKCFRAWGIGIKGKDNGVLLTIFKEDRQIWIENGYGVEPQLPDAVTARIYRNQLVPAFREQKFAEGIRAAVASIEAALSGEAPPPSRRQKKRMPPAGALILVVFIILAIVSSIAQNAARRPATLTGRRALRRVYPWWWGGFGGGGFGGGGFGGGGFGGGGGGGFGGGGFSGGGGSSGGGGAGGSW